MSTYALELSAKLENCSNLRPNFYATYKWYMRVKCSGCGTKSDQWYYACPKEFESINGDKVHIKDKCSSCGQNFSLEILDDSYRPYRIERNDEWQAILKFYCHGLEPVDFDFDYENGWFVESTNSKSTFDVDMELEKWVDYDEKSGLKVKITDIDYRYSAVKKPTSV